MKKNHNQYKKVYRDYKLTIINNPVDNSKFVYAYHYVLGFGASFENKSDAIFWLEGFRPDRKLW